MYIYLTVKAKCDHRSKFSNLELFHIYFIPNSVAQFQKEIQEKFRWAPKLTEAKSYLKLLI